MFQFALGSTPAPLPDPDTSVTVVEQARAGDHAAFTALFQHYNAPICRYLAHLVGNDELGRDLAQDTFLAAWRALQTSATAAALAPGSIALRPTRPTPMCARRASPAGSPGPNRLSHRRRTFQRLPGQRPRWARPSRWRRPWRS